MVLHPFTTWFSRGNPLLLYQWAQLALEVLSASPLPAARRPRAEARGAVMRKVRPLALRRDGDYVDVERVPGRRSRRAAQADWHGRLNAEERQIDCTAPIRAG